MTVWRAWLLLLIGGMCCERVLAADVPFFQDTERGWFWYEDPEPAAQDIKKPEVTAAPQAPTAREILRKEGEIMEESMAKAQLEPTPENIRDYIEKSQAITARARRFSSAFKDEILFQPRYVTAKQNLSAPVRTLAGNLEEEAFTKKLQESSTKYSLVFFLRSDCPFCHRFAPLLKLISEELGYVVLPVSLDGEGLPDFPQARFSPQLVERMAVKQVPAVFLLSPERNITQPVSFGYVGYSDFRERLSRAISYVDRQDAGGH